MTSLTKNPHPPTKEFFRVQTTRLDRSFGPFTRSIALTGPEKFPHKATCNPAVFMRTAWINPAANVSNASWQLCHQDSSISCEEAVCTCLCTGITPTSKVLESCSNAQHWASLLVCNEKNFFVWDFGFFMSDVVSGGLLGHFGPLHLVLGPNY